MDKLRLTSNESDWLSPWRLHETTRYDFPGDRFIPNRSLMNLDQAHCLLTNPPSKEVRDSHFGNAYQKKLMENMTLDTEGRPFRMLVFRGSPKSSRKPTLHIDAMRREDADALLSDATKQFQPRRLPKAESRVLDAPNLINDFYANIMDWGNNNVLAVALGWQVYLWNSETEDIQKLFKVQELGNEPTSIAWSEDARSLAVGYLSSRLQIFDTETCKCIRNLEGHKARIATISWNGSTLTSGSRDRCIINHDVRSRNNPTSCIKAHTQEVCGLKWSTGGNVLASGGNENLIYIWDASRMSSSNFLHCLTGHTAAVKALAWCPYQLNVLASGGGTDDGCIKLWNTQRGTCIDSINTKAQICGLEWNRHHKEILSGHGYGVGQLQNHLCLWKYPSMKKVGELARHESRIINLSQSPDGLTVVSAGGDETLRFWDIFGPPRSEDSNSSSLDRLLSLKSSPIR